MFCCNSIIVQSTYLNKFNSLGIADWSGASPASYFLTFVLVFVYHARVGTIISASYFQINESYGNIIAGNVTALSAASG